MGKKAVIITYGCQMNVNDSAKIKNVLVDMGYEMIDDIKDADAVFINTCTVRDGAAKKVYGKLGELKHLKAKKSDMIVGVTGCLAQEEKEEVRKKVKFVDMVLGNQNIYKIPEYIEKILNKDLKNVILVDNEDELPPRIDAQFDSTITACISIMYGCNNFCTYCIVPYVRGRERSVTQEDIIKDVKSYIEKGYKEIMLLGQNVNSYNGGGKAFAELLRAIAAVEGKFRIRFTSPHPRDFSDEVIEVIATEDKICKNVHLPLQAGSTSVLEKMNRGYTKEEYIELAKKIQKRMPDVALTTDIIVGFPGESEENFLDTLDVVEKVGFDNAYMFMYSKRKGTPAEIMEGQIEEDVKEERLQRLIKLQTAVTKAESEKYLGKEIEVLVEGTTRKNDKAYTGRSDTNKVVIFSGNDEMIGKFVKMKIVDAKTWTLYGECVE